MIIVVSLKVMQLYFPLYFDSLKERAVKKCFKMMKFGILSFHQILVVFIHYSQKCTICNVQYALQVPSNNPTNNTRHSCGQIEIHCTF